jgi:hypothetical protein
MSLTTSVNVSIQANNTRTLDQRIATDTIPFSVIATLADGTGAGKNNKVFYDERTLADGATEDLDMSGALTDGFGQAVVFTKIRLIAIFSVAANTTLLTVGGDAASVPIFGAVNDVLSVAPGGAFVLYNPSLAGIGVTATTGDIIQVANAAGAEAVYRILVCGE